MDEKLGKFIDDFAQLVQIAQSGQHRVESGRQLLTTITDHLAVPAESLAVVVEEVPAHRFVDADILMAELAAEDEQFRLVGIGGGDQRHHQSLSDMLQQSQFFPQFPLSQPDYINLAAGPDEQRQAVALGLWLFRHSGRPVAVLQRDAAPQYGRQTACLEVLAADSRNAADFLAEFRRRMQRGSVLKGQGHLPGHGRIRAQHRRRNVPCTARTLGLRRHPPPGAAAESGRPRAGHRRTPGVPEGVRPAPETRHPAVWPAGDRQDPHGAAALDERIGLVTLYARGIPFTADAVRDAAVRTEGTTASFARELVRRAVVRAALDGEPVQDSYLLAAVDELMADGETLTRSLLGSGPAGGGDRQDGFMGPGGPGHGFPGPGFPGPGFFGPDSGTIGFDGPA